MVKDIVFAVLFVISGSMIGFGLRGLVQGPMGENLEDANRWTCMIKAIETGECVGYRWSDKRLEDADARHRKQHPQQRPSVQQKQQDGARRIEIQQ